MAPEASAKLSAAFAAGYAVFRSVGCAWEGDVLAVALFGNCVPVALALAAWEHSERDGTAAVVRLVLWKFA